MVREEKDSMHDDEYEEYEDDEDGYESEDEAYPEPPPPDYSFPTCAFYSPPASVIEAGEGALPTTWPYDRALPYAACINRMVVGPEALGTCRCANQTMPSCHGYQAEAPVVLETWADPDDITVVLARARRGLGEPVFIVADRAHATEAEARSSYTDLRLGLGATRQLRPEQARFLAELIRA